MNSRHGVLLVLGTALISGVSIFLNKFALSSIEPYTFTFLKNALVGVFLLLFLLMRKDFGQLRLLSQKQWAQLLGIGVLGGGIPFVLFFHGLSLTNAAAGSFLQKTMFIFVAAIGIFFLREKIPQKIWIPSILLIAGSFLLAKLNGLTFGEGELFVLAATLFWAVEIHLSKRVLSNVSGNMVAAARMSIGALAIFSFLLFTGRAETVLTISPDGWMWTIFTSLLLLGYVTTFYNGLKLIKPTTATALLVVGSPITTLLSMVFSNAPLALNIMGGIALTIGGAALYVWWNELGPGAKAHLVRDNSHA